MKIHKDGLRSLPILLLLFVLSFSNPHPSNVQRVYSNSDSNISSPYMNYLPIIFTEPGYIAGVYYLSPSGNDNNSGTTESRAWATFDRALNKNTPGNKLLPGDTLILLDGIYNQSIGPYFVGGLPGKPITIRAKNDGQAIIDGEGVRIPVYLEGWKQASYYDIEGIIARNSSASVFSIFTDNNVFRRVSGYNANTDGNNHVFLINANNNLIEDCVAAGSGRKMMLIFGEEKHHNTIRRCFGSYREQDMRNWHDAWPWNDTFDSYNADYNTFENDIAYGYYAYTGFRLWAQGDGSTSVGNKLLGSIAVMGGFDYLGNPLHWGDIRPQPTQYSLISNLYEPSHRTGIAIGHGSSIIEDNLLQDVLSWGNASVGLCVVETPQLINNIFNRVSIYNNGLDMPSFNNTIDARRDDLSGITITNSRIDVIKPDTLPITGEGARLQNRYIEGVLKDGSDGTPAQPLWPWPMEQRIRDEMGISVTNLIAGIIPNQVSSIPDTNRPFLAISPVIQAFGNVPMGQSASKLVNLKNIGSASLTIDEYQFGGSNSDFALTPGGTCPNPPFLLAPAQSCSINISFSPQSNQLQSDDLYFYSSDIAIYPLVPSVYVSGKGY